jgi:hypothetical protein
MLSDDVRQKLQHIVRGTVIETAQDHCTTIRNFLCSGYSTSTAVKTNFESQLIIKEEQAERLKQFATINNLWLLSLPQDSQYLTRGGESKVYLDSDNRHVIKINDAVYYATWLEYFNSLVLHNLIFPGTAYDLLGFSNIDGNLHAAVRQLYITSDAPVNLADTSAFLLSNGFVNTRRQDYFNAEYGLILEDMHDENVLMNTNTLFFIDTVFYTVKV